MLLNLKSAMLIYHLNCDDVITSCCYEINDYIITYTHYAAKSSIKSTLLISVHTQLISDIQLISLAKLTISLSQWVNFLFISMKHCFRVKQD